MKYSKKHIVAFGRLLVLLFVLANAGFTAVLHKCSMENTQVTKLAECCGNSDESNRLACELPQSMSSSTHGVQFTCHTNTIVGGLTGTTALLEKKSKIQLSKFSERQVSLHQVSTFTSDVIHSIYFSFSSTSISPPSVEKCVLYSSFLI